jgi:hypothetical protein
MRKNIVSAPYQHFPEQDMIWFRDEAKSNQPTRGRWWYKFQIQYKNTSEPNIWNHCDGRHKFTHMQKNIVSAPYQHFPKQKTWLGSAMKLNLTNLHGADVARWLQITTDQMQYKNTSEPQYLKSQWRTKKGTVENGDLVVYSLSSESCAIKIYNTALALRLNSTKLRTCGQI